MLAFHVNMFIGPLPNTLEDFWRMIWEYKLNTVVMLTKCFEERVNIIIVVIIDYSMQTWCVSNHNKALNSKDSMAKCMKIQ